MLKKVIIADDHPLFLLGLRVALDKLGGFDVINEAHTVDELLAALADVTPDILVTDFSMPGSKSVDGLRLIKNIRVMYPSLPIIVITILANNGIVEALYKCGVHRVISKKSLSSELVKALGSVGTIGLEKRGRSRKRVNTIHKKLSPKEFEVMRMFSEGCTVTEIALKLNRTKQTISSQKKSMMAKLGVSTEAEFFEYILQTGL